jgi:hypothetical protein
VDEDFVGERMFNGYKYWEKYTEKQYDSLLNLIKHIISKTKIKGDFSTNNLYDIDCMNISGIISRSNIIENIFDVNPLFNFEIFNKL